MKKYLVAFTGAGISAESGLKTFRDSGGLWEEYDISEVATPEAWAANPQLVLEFYNQRRLQVEQAQPNIAHYKLVELEKRYDVQIITQNVDDLHERAGSKNVLHLHGEVRKARSSVDPRLIYPVSGELKWGDCCEKGSQLRPHVVWFGEEVPNMQIAYDMVSRADILLIVGTSLNVYPAAGLINYAPAQSLVYLIDPNAKSMDYMDNLITIKEKASMGLSMLAEKLMEKV